MVTSGKIVVLAPTQTLFPIVIGLALICSLRLSTLWLEEIIETPGPSSMLFPKWIPLFAWI